jgi:hypothetical protein
MQRPMIVSFILIITAFIILLFNKEDLTNELDIPDITIKYGNIFFILSGMYSVRWLAKDNYQRGWVLLMVSLIQGYIAFLHFKEHKTFMASQPT